MRSLFLTRKKTSSLLGCQPATHVYTENLSIKKPICDFQIYAELKIWACGDNLYSFCPYISNQIIIKYVTYLHKVQKILMTQIITMVWLLT